MSTAVTFEKISQDESWRVFNDTSQRLMGMGADELAKRWDAGELLSSVDPMRALMLRPSGW
jgi:hypothetical protein